MSKGRLICNWSKSIIGYFFRLVGNAWPAAASAGFTCLMFSFSLSFPGLMNAHIRKPPALLAAGLLAPVYF